VRDCHAALLFGDIRSPGSRGLQRDCEALGKPLVWVKPGLSTPRHIRQFLTESRHITRLLVAGERESRDPGIGVRVERFLLVVFTSLGPMARQDR
jgi:Circularly permutated YpsA SLOG family